jgi:hypothetical protein
MSRARQNLITETLYELPDQNSISPWRTRSNASKDLENTVRENYSLRRVLEKGFQIDGFEKEVSDYMAKTRELDVAGCLVPWAYFTRSSPPDLSVSASSAEGGALVQTTLTPTVKDVLRPYSSVVAAGCSVVDNLVGNFQFPRQLTTTGPVWQATENVPDTSVGPTFGILNLSPLRLTTEVRISNQLIAQSSYSVTDLLHRTILKSVSSVLDNAMLNGAGSGGVPLGLLNTAENASLTTGDYSKLAPGVTFGGGSGAATWSSVLQLQYNVETGLGGGGDEALAYISSPNVKRAFSQILKVPSADQLIWEDGQINNCPAYATTNMSSDQLICGAFSNFVLALWALDFCIDNMSLASVFQTRVICTALANAGVIRGVAIAKSENSVASG